MKQRALLFAMAAFVFVACTTGEVEQEINLPLPDGVEVVFTAMTETGSPNTKTELSENHVLWSPGDEISLFCGGNGRSYKFTAQNSYPAATVDFSGIIDQAHSDALNAGTVDVPFWAVYPYASDNACDGESVTLCVPSMQVADTYTFAPKSFPSVARSMNNELRFYNVCGGIKLKFSRSDITCVNIESNNGEPLSGTVKVAFDSNNRPYVKEVANGVDFIDFCPAYSTFDTDRDYFISVLPGALSGGLTFTFELEDPNVFGTKEVNKSLTVKRNTFGNVGVIDNNVEWELDVTSTPETVDLGLSVNWASCNLGAETPDEYGYFFAWGEILPKENYDWSTYKWANGSSSSITKYNLRDVVYTLKPEDDAATVQFGDGWRTPTSAEIQELLDGCTWSNRSVGYARTLVGTSKADPTKSISFPMTGWMNESVNSDANGRVAFWSADLSYSLIEQADEFFCKYAYTPSPSIYYIDRCYGLPIRPVYVDPNKVSSVKLDKTSLEIGVGISVALTATVLPETATDKSVSWSSSDTQVATVNSSGVVTAKSAGTATITVTTHDRNKTATCQVTVADYKFAEHNRNYWFDDVQSGTYNTVRCNVRIPTCWLPSNSPENNDDVTVLEKDLTDFWVGNEVKLKLNGSVVTDNSIKFKFVFYQGQPVIGGSLFTAKENGSYLYYKNVPCVSLNPDGRIRYAWEQSQAQKLINKWGTDSTSVSDFLYTNVDLIAYKEAPEYTELCKEQMHVRFLRPITIYNGDNALLHDAVSDGDAIHLGDMFTLRDWNRTSDPNGYRLFKKDGGTFRSCYYPNDNNQSSARVYWYGYYGISSLSIDVDKIQTDQGGSWAMIKDVNPTARFWLAPANDHTDHISGQVDIRDVSVLGNVDFVYSNNAGSAYDFNLKVPVTIGYSWGYLTNYVTVPVKGRNSQPNQ